MKTQNILGVIGVVVLCILAGIVGRLFIPVPAPQVRAAEPSLEEQYAEKVKPLWDELITLSRAVESRLSTTSPEKLKELARLAQEQRERLQYIQGQVDGMTCPPSLNEQREDLRSGLESHRKFLERLHNVAIRTAGEQDLADMASNGELAGQYYQEAKLAGWQNFPAYVFNIRGKLERTVQKAAPAPQGPLADGSGAIKGVIEVRDPAERLYRTELIQLVRAYEASRKQFNAELQHSYYNSYAASEAYNQRVDIRNRLAQLEPAPTRYMVVHTTFKSLLNQAIDAVRDYYNTRNRVQLTRASASIGARLTAVKRALGIR